MPRRKKITEDAANDLDVKLIHAWADFNKRLAEFAENVNKCEVELRFESSLDHRTHFGFEPDEIVFIGGVEVSESSEVRFLVPRGAATKSFNINEAELIKAHHADGSTNNLNEVFENLFAGCFKDIDVVGGIKDIQGKYLCYHEYRELFNNAEAAIKQHKLKVDRETKYSKLKMYGLF